MLDICNRLFMDSKDWVDKHPKMSTILAIFMGSVYFIFNRINFLRFIVSFIGLFIFIFIVNFKAEIKMKKELEIYRIKTGHNLTILYFSVMHIIGLFIAMGIGAIINAWIDNTLVDILSRVIATIVLYVIWIKTDMLVIKKQLKKVN